LGRPEGMTAVYVTHDQAEAFAIADQIAVMNNGRIEQIGSSQTVYRQPATPFVARFLGMENIFEAKLVAQNPPTLEIGDWRLEIDPLTINHLPLTMNHSYPPPHPPRGRRD
jgi:ABC-type Fe3+/spermidine/putrescine transport system ATPase subunit